MIIRNIKLLFLGGGDLHSPKTRVYIPFFTCGYVHSPFFICSPVHSPFFACGRFEALFTTLFSYPALFTASFSYDALFITPFSYDALFTAPVSHAAASRLCSQPLFLHADASRSCSPPFPIRPLRDLKRLSDLAKKTTTITSNTFLYLIFQ